MESNWKDAPDWVKYRATDKDGETFYHEKEPKTYKGGWWISSGRICRVTKSIIGWTDTLEKRPEESQ